MQNQFSRTQLLLGKPAMETLANSRVAVFGVGGVGGYTVEVLARSGVGAIDIIDGKARLVRENYCDGLGDCLPSCPTGAITFEERDALEYDDAAVKRTQEKAKKKKVN